LPKTATLLALYEGAAGGAVTVADGTGATEAAGVAVLEVTYS